MASPRISSLFVCGALLLLVALASAQRGGGDRQRPGATQRPGGTGEFWPGAGPPSGGQQPSGGEFWPGSGPSTRPPRPSTRPPPGPSSGCSCPSTPEYNPVCGTDGVTYGNPGKLNCARMCGRNVSVLHYGNCTPADPNAPTTSTTPSSTTTRRRRP